MVKHLFRFLFTTILLSPQLIYSQPSKDLTWVVINSKSSEFNSTTLNPLFTVLNNQYGWGCEYFSSSNCTLSGQDLVLTVNGTYPPKKDCSSSYYSGGVVSNNNFGYGYYEINTKLPDGAGFWPCFWLMSSEDDWVNTPYHIVWYDEIDILEPSGSQYDNHTNVSGWWDELHPSVDFNLAKFPTGGFWMQNLPDLHSNYHKFGLMWNSGKIKLYFDDQLKYESPADLSYTVPNHEVLSLFIDLQISAMPSNFSNKLPASMYVDYFRHYQKVVNDCNKDEIFSNCDLTTFDNRNVKKSITISNTTVPNNYYTDIRATDYILLNSNFTVPLGTEFTAATITCP